MIRLLPIHYIYQGIIGIPSWDCVLLGVYVTRPGSTALALGGVTVAISLSTDVFEIIKSKRSNSWGISIQTEKE